MTPSQKRTGSWPCGQSAPPLRRPSSPSARRARISAQRRLEQIDILVVVRARSKRAARRHVAKAHRLQHMARPDLARRTGRAGRKRDAGKIERDLRRLGLHAGNSEKHRVGKTLRRRARKFPRRARASGWSPRSGRASRATASMCQRARARLAPPRRSRRSPARFSVPARWPFSWPPPVISGLGIIRSDAATMAPTPFGPPILCEERIR